MSEIELVVDIDAPVETVWPWISTGDGLSRWFVDAEVVPGPSGSVTLTFAPGATGTLPIQTWAPPTRFRMGAGPDEPGRAHDFTLTPAGDGSSLRFVDAGLSADEVSATEAGWRLMLGRLKARVEALSVSSGPAPQD